MQLGRPTHFLELFLDFRTLFSSKVCLKWWHTVGTSQANSSHMYNYTTVTHEGSKLCSQPAPEVSPAQCARREEASIVHLFAERLHGKRCHAIYGHIHGHIWPYMPTYARTCPYMSVHAHIWPYIYGLAYDHIWTFFAIYGHIWTYMTIYVVIYSHI